MATEIEYAYNENKPEFEPSYRVIQGEPGAYDAEYRARQLRDYGYTIVKREVVRGDWEEYNE